MSVDMNERADSLANICSMVFDPEYGLMHFACTGQTENAYQILINHTETKYLPRKDGKPVSNLGAIPVAFVWGKTQNRCNRRKRKTIDRCTYVAQRYGGHNTAAHRA